MSPPAGSARTAVATTTVIASLAVILLIGCAPPEPVITAPLEVYRPNPVPAKDIPAFPRAEGFGAYTPGGRGGKIHVVTTLADAEPNQPLPPGSLREAVEAEGPRIVVFAVAGTITLKAPLVVAYPYLSLEGQTAPGGGVCLSGEGLVVATHDVILRHLRLRPAGKGSPDALSLRHAKNVIVDHCSMSWSGDELCAATKQCSDVTIQWCLLSEPLNRRGHAQPVVLSGQRISFHHNLIAHGDRCNPLLDGEGPLDVRNNLIVNWRSQAASGKADRVNLVANAFEPGPDTRARGGMEAATLYWVQDRSPSRSLYVVANVLGDDLEGTADNWSRIAPTSMDPLLTFTPEEFVARYRAVRPFPVEEVETELAAEAAEKILKFAGATLPQRDAVDARVVAAILDGTGRIINEVADVGGPGALPAGQARDDRDRDGMTNGWENRHGLNSHDPNDGVADKDADGYTNVEEFLNGTDPRRPMPWVAPPVITPEDGSIFVATTEVALSCPTPGVEIRYTLDGTTPTRHSPLYGSRFTLPFSATVKARAFKGMLASRMSYAELRQVAPQPAVRVRGLEPGLAYAYAAPGPAGPEGHDTVWNVVKRDTVDVPRVDWLDEDARMPKVDFTGYVEVPRTGIYTFTLLSPANCELWLDGAQAILNDTGRYGRVRVTAALERGLHSLRLHYFTWGTPLPVKLSWKGPRLDEQPIPAEAFSHLPPE